MQCTNSMYTVKRVSVKAVNIANMLPCQARYQHQEKQQIGLDVNQMTAEPDMWDYSNFNSKSFFFFLMYDYCSWNSYIAYIVLVSHVDSFTLSAVCFSIGQTFTSRGTQTTTPGSRTCVSPPIWFGCQIFSSTTGGTSSETFHLLIQPPILSRILAPNS